MDPSVTSSTSQISVDPPRRFTAAAVFVVSAYGMLLMLPVLISLLAVSVLPLGLLTLVVPAVTVGLATFLLPFGFGNPFVARIAMSVADGAGARAGSVLVQLTAEPRIRTGFRGLIEDADDIGWLELGESGLVFRGDAVNLSVGYDQITQVRRESIGWRGLFLYPRLRVTVRGLPRIKELGFAERASWCLPVSRRKTLELENGLKARMASHRGASSGD